MCSLQSLFPINIEPRRSMALMQTPTPTENPRTPAIIPPAQSADASLPCSLQKDMCSLQSLFPINIEPRRSMTIAAIMVEEILSLKNTHINFFSAALIEDNSHSFEFVDKSISAAINFPLVLPLDGNAVYCSTEKSLCLNDVSYMLASIPFYCSSVSDDEQLGLSEQSSLICKNVHPQLQGCQATAIAEIATSTSSSLKDLNVADSCILQKNEQVCIRGDKSDSALHEGTPPTTTFLPVKKIFTSLEVLFPIKWHNGGFCTFEAFSLREYVSGMSPRCEEKIEILVRCADPAANIEFVTSHEVSYAEISVDIPNVTSQDHVSELTDVATVINIMRMDNCITEESTTPMNTHAFVPQSDLIYSPSKALVLPPTLKVFHENCASSSMISCHSVPNSNAHCDADCDVTIDTGSMKLYPQNKGFVSSESPINSFDKNSLFDDLDSAKEIEKGTTSKSAHDDDSPMEAVGPDPIIGTPALGNAFFSIDDSSNSGTTNELLQQRDTTLTALNVSCIDNSAQLPIQVENGGKATIASPSGQTFASSEVVREVKCIESYPWSSFAVRSAEDASSDSTAQQQRSLRKRRYISTNKPSGAVGETSLSKVSVISRHERDQIAFFDLTSAPADSSKDDSQVQPKKSDSKVNIEALGDLSIKREPKKSWFSDAIDNKSQGGITSSHAPKIDFKEITKSWFDDDRPCIEEKNAAKYTPESHIPTVTAANTVARTPNILGEDSKIVVHQQAHNHESLASNQFHELSSNMMIPLIKRATMFETTQKSSVDTEVRNQTGKSFPGSASAGKPYKDSETTVNQEDSSVSNCRSSSDVVARIGGLKKKSTSEANYERVPKPRVAYKKAVRFSKINTYHTYDNSAVDDYEDNSASYEEICGDELERSGVAINFRESRIEESTDTLVSTQIPKTPRVSDTVATSSSDKASICFTDAVILDDKEAPSDKDDSRTPHIDEALSRNDCVHQKKDIGDSSLIFELNKCDIKQEKNYVEDECGGNEASDDKDSDTYWDLTAEDEENDDCIFEDYSPSSFHSNFNLEYSTPCLTKVPREYNAHIGDRLKRMADPICVQIQDGEDCDIFETPVKMIGNFNYLYK